MWKQNRFSAANNLAAYGRQGYGAANSNYGPSGSGYGTSGASYGSSGSGLSGGGRSSGYGSTGYSQPSYGSYSGGYGKTECPGISLALLLITLAGIAVLGVILFLKIQNPTGRKKRSEISWEDFLELAIIGRNHS